MPIRLSPTDVEFVNDSRDDKCLICGSVFDEGGVCANQHERGRTYFCDPADLQGGPAKIRHVPVVIAPQSAEICHEIGGGRCSICMSYIGDGDDICAQGHQIGQKYAAA